MSALTPDPRRAEPIGSLFGRSAPAARAFLLGTAVALAVLLVACWTTAAIIDLHAHLAHQAVAASAGRDPRAQVRTDLDQISLAALAAFLAVAALGPAALGLDRTGRARPLAGTARTFAVLHLPSMWLGIGLTLFWAHANAGAGSYHPAPEPLVVALTGAVTAGFCEEILVLAIPLAAAHACGLTRLRVRGLPAGWALVGLVLTAARISYHVYYGLGALPLLPWAIASIVWFTRTRALLPLITAHAAYDIAVTLAPTASPAAFWTWAGLLTLVGAGAGLAGHRRITGAGRVQQAAGTGR